MLTMKDSKARIIGWREFYISDHEITEVAAVGNINTITTRDRTTGKVETKTIFGMLPMPPEKGLSARGRLDLTPTRPGANREALRDLHSSIDSRPASGDATLGSAGNGTPLRIASMGIELLSPRFPAVKGILALVAMLFAVASLVSWFYYYRNDEVRLYRRKSE